MTVIPEHSLGYARPAAAGAFTLSASGTFYTESTCSVNATFPVAYTDTSKVFVFYYKYTSAGTDTISLTANSGPLTPGSNITTTVNAGSVGAAAGLVLTGRSGNIIGNENQCQPYAVSVIDSAGNSVDLGSDQSISMTESASGGTISTWDGADCNTNYVWDPPTSIPATNDYAIAYRSASQNVGATANLGATGSGLTAAPTISVLGQ